jgi:arylsulfatase A-like enzyme
MKWRVNAGEVPLTKQSRAQHAAAYDAAVRQADDVLAEILGLLDRYGLRKDALVVITSDHGEGLGAHAELGHSISVWEEQLQIPLLIARPRVGGSRVARRVSQLWLMPSLLDWLEVERPPHLRGAPSLEGPPAPITGDYRNYFSENQREKNLKMRERFPALARATQHMHVVYCGDNKLIVAADGSRRYFDLAADPDEQRPLSPDAPTALACERKYAGLLAAGHFTPFETVLTDEQQQRADAVYDEESLRELGYIE